jgi:hypothetical protein
MYVNRDFLDRVSLVLKIKRNTQKDESYFISIQKSHHGKLWLKCDLGGSY